VLSDVFDIPQKHIELLLTECLSETCFGVCLVSIIGEHQRD
jgi:hypothetical protein